MLGLIITSFIMFLSLFGLIRIFERGRDDLDSFQVATVAVVPILIVVLVRVVLGLLYPRPILMLVLPPLVLIGSTFFLLYKNLEISLGRSIGYTVAVVGVNEILALAFALI